ncbi:MAG: RtcB family protein [Spirochaetes bacterium]|nr:RtcB family protein [Spirochaetota bacterium]
MSETNTKAIAIKGKHNGAIVYAKALETVCENKILQYLDHPAFAGTKVRIMPDVHLGKSTVIGWTATYGELVIPSVIGLDIGCGICACNLGRGKLAFDKLDKFIRKHIPAGQAVHSSTDDAEHSLFAEDGFDENEIRALCEKYACDAERIFASLGTLGGGNHFIEVDIDESGSRWLLVHSGSRAFGARCAEYHQVMALREAPADSYIKYLSGSYAKDYLADLQIVQRYARLNRAVMARTIVEKFFKLDMGETGYLDCMHNFIDADRKIIRKGAISAQEGEPLVIPFSMSEGAVLATGKGNADWNFSAPHGSGRKKARTDAKSLSLDEYRKEMRGIWSSVICKDTLEESPMAYKKPKDVLDYIEETAEVQQRLRPVYNFKAVN